MHRVRRLRGGVQDASAALFTSAKVTHLSLLPQGQVERDARVVAMVNRHDAEGFGSCSNEGECEAVCPKSIAITNIARMNREWRPSACAACALPSLRRLAVSCTGVRRSWFAAGGAWRLGVDGSYIVASGEQGLEAGQDEAGRAHDHQAQAVRHAAPPGLDQLAHDHVPLECGQVIDEQDAVEMVDLVLDAASEEAIGLEHPLLALVAR